MTDKSDDEGCETSVSEHDTDIICELDRNQPASEVVVRAVASLTNTAVLDLDPLYGAIDPDRLDRIFDNANDGDPLEITFRFNGCQVIIDQGAVHVQAGVK